MKTRDILQVVYGQDSEVTGLQTRLADIADSLVASHDERESRRMAEAEVRDQLAGYGPLLDQAQYALAAEQTQALTDSRLPAVMTFDAYCLMKDAAKAEPSDRGLKQAAHVLYDRWTQDPIGHLTVGELTSFRDHFVDMFPKSAAKQIFDEAIPNAGFNTLSDLPRLTRIAADITDQGTYERAMELHGLDGDRPEQIRARAYIKGIAELALSDEAFKPMTLPSAQGAVERATMRVAQELFGEHDDMQVAPGEEALPHDENSEEMATIDSPVTGRPLVVELGVEEEGEESQNVDGMEPEYDINEESARAAPFPSHFDSDVRVAQQLPLELAQSPAKMLPDAAKKLPAKLQRLMTLAHGKLIRASDGTFVFEFQDEDTADMFAEQARGQVSGNRVIVKSAQITVDQASEVSETMTTMIDPTSGEEVQVILKHITDEEPEEFNEELDEEFNEESEELNDSDTTSMIDDMDEMGLAHTAADSALYRKTLPQTVHTKSPKHTQNIQPEYWSSPAGEDYLEDYTLSEEEQEQDLRDDLNERKRRLLKRKKAERGFDEVMNVQVPAQQKPSSKLKKLDPQKFFSAEDKKSKNKKAQKLTAEQVRTVCARMGLSAENIEEQLLDGNEIAAGTYAIRIGSQDEVELRRLAHVNTTEGARVIRTASLVEFDGIVADFMALTAAQFALKPETVRTAAKRNVEKTGSFVLSSDVPQGAPINARRMMASVWKIVPDAEGELMDDGRLAILLRTAAQRDVNRIQRVLTDVFGIAHIEAQMLPTAPTSEESSTQELQQDNADSPYVGQTPVNRQPAGQPMKPLQAPQQTAQTGSGAQQEFIARHTDPFARQSSEADFWNAKQDLEQALRDEDYVDACAARGNVQDAVRDATNNTAIQAVLSRIAPEELARELKEYGAWSAEELEDHNENLERFVWLTACDLKESDAESESETESKVDTNIEPSPKLKSPRKQRTFRGPHYDASKRAQVMDAPNTGASNGTKDSDDALSDLSEDESFDERAEGGDGSELGDLSELLQAAIDLGVPMDLAQEVIDTSPEEMAHRLRVNGLDDTAEEIRWRALHREAQLEDAEELPEGDEESLEDAPDDDDMSLDDAEMAGEMAGDSDLANDLESAPADPTGMQTPASGMGLGMDLMMPGASQDASQMTLDMAEGQLQPEDEEAVHAAATHFRNTGMMPLEAISQFLSKYGAILDKYGNETSPQRLMAHGTAIRLLMEAFSKPAVVPVKQASKQAKKPGKSKSSKDWPVGELPSPPAPSTQLGSPSGTFSDTKFRDKSHSHAWGGDKKPGNPQKGSRTKQPGTSFSTTDMNEAGHKSMSDKMDALSHSAPSTVRSTEKGKKADLLIHFDPELGDFHLSRGEKRIAIHASLNEALADAERRRFGTDSRILIDDGQGGFNEA